MSTVFPSQGLSGLAPVVPQTPSAPAQGGFNELLNQVNGILDRADQLAAGYAQGKGNVAATATTSGYSGTSSEEDFIGAGYAAGAFAVRLQWGEFKFGYGGVSGTPSYGNPADDVKEIGIGFDWKDGANTVNLSYYNAKDDGPNLGAKTIDFAVLDTYALSKRTSVYGQIGYVKADAATATTGPGQSEAIAAFYTAGGAPVAGHSSTIVGIGMQHMF